jgi:dTMP kinase
MFITFEGIDFCGKSTQLTRIAAWYATHGRECLLVREPGGTDISEQIRAVLLHDRNAEMDPITETLLFSAARSQLVAQKILPALQAGIPVLADRFFDSTTAYQGYGRGIDTSTIRAIHALATRGLNPDLTLLFDIDVRESYRRRAIMARAVDRMEQADEPFFERVRAGYSEISRLNGDRFVTVGGSLPVDEVTAAVKRIIRDRFDETMTWKD